MDAKLQDPQDAKKTEAKRGVAAETRLGYEHGTGLFRVAGAGRSEDLI
jgi:hypothetical protein